MTELQIICLAIIIALIGMIIIAIYPCNAPVIKISDVTNHIGSIITVRGIVIKNHQISSGVRFLEIYDGQERLKIVDFHNKFSKYKKGDFIQCTGKVKLYNNNIELVAYD